MTVKRYAKSWKQVFALMLDQIDCSTYGSNTTSGMLLVLSDIFIPLYKCFLFCVEPVLDSFDIVTFAFSWTRLKRLRHQ